MPEHAAELQRDRGKIACGTRAHLVAPFWGDAAGQRAATAAVSPASFKVEPGQTGGYGARAADRIDALARTGAAAIRIERHPAADERAPNSCADRSDSGRGRSRLGTESHSPTGKFRREQSVHIFVFNGGRKVRQGYQCFARKFSG